jgi:soluble lytic murein transglycosylase-like protein
MRSLIVLTLLMLPAIAAADHELACSMRCIKHFHPNEQKYGIPRDALYSISLKETGRKHSTKGATIVWPWTANVEGKGYYFDTKSEAVHFVRSQLLRGVDSIDVGCMQVNLKAHPDAFRSVEDALDPKTNIAYGASFLYSKYEQLGSWHKAVAHYHSATPEHGVPYKNDVVKIARNIDKYKDVFRKSRARRELSNQHNVAHKPTAQERREVASRSKRHRSDMMVHVPRGARS